jgi:hypothetical protein
LDVTTKIIRRCHPMPHVIQHSAALGGAKLVELNTNGEKVKGYVYGGGVLLAKQEVFPSSGGSGVKWRHANPGSASWAETDAGRAVGRQEMDPLGAEVGTHDPYLILVDPSYSDVHSDSPMFVDGGDPFHLSDGCGTIDGMPASCSEVGERTGNGTAVADPGMMWGRRRDATTGRLENFVAALPPIYAPSSSGMTGQVPVYSSPACTSVDNGPLDCSPPSVIGYTTGAGGPLASGFVPQQPQNPALAALGEDTTRRLNNALAHLTFDLETGVSESCQRHVIEPLGWIGFNLNDFVGFLNRGGTFYDGTRSSANYAGTVTTQAAANAQGRGSSTIAQVFRNEGGLNAVTSVLAPTLTVFLRPGRVNSSNRGANAENKALLFHEGLHGYGGSLGGTSFFDDQIQNALGIDVQADSSNITRHIRRYCF